jgi:hypothetical protein
MYQYQRINPYWTALMPPIERFTISGIPGIPQQNIISDNDTYNIGSGTQIVGGGNPSPVTVTDVTTPTYTALATDYFLCVDTATAPVTITLPTGILGTVYIIKDCSGDAATNPITIQGTGGELVDGSVGTVNTPYGSVSLIFNGTEWSIV